MFWSWKSSVTALLFHCVLLPVRRTETRPGLCQIQEVFIGAENVLELKSFFNSFSFLRISFLGLFLTCQWTADGNLHKLQEYFFRKQHGYNWSDGGPPDSRVFIPEPVLIILRKTNSKIYKHKAVCEQTQNSNFSFGSNKISVSLVLSKTVLFISPLYTLLDYFSQIGCALLYYSWPPLRFLHGSDRLRPSSDMVNVAQRGP